MRYRFFCLYELIQVFLKLISQTLAVIIYCKTLCAYVCTCVFRCVHMCPVSLRGSNTLWLDGVPGSCEQPRMHAGSIICFSCKSSRHSELLSLLSIPQIKFLDSTYQRGHVAFLSTPGLFLDTMSSVGTHCC